MRTWTYVGIASAIFLALFPFMISESLFYGAENTKVFFFLGVIDVLLLWSAFRLWTTNTRFSWKGKWFLYASLAVIAVEYLAAFLGVNTERSLWSDIARSTGVLLITHMFVGAYLLALNLKKTDWSIIRRSVAVSAAIFSFIVFLGIDGFGLHSDFLWFSLNLSGSTIGNTTFAGAYVVLALILGLIELCHTDSEDTWRLGLLASIGVILVSPLLIGSNLLFNGTTFAEVLKSPSLLVGTARSSSVVAYALMMFMGGVLLLKKLPETIKNTALWGWAGAWMGAIIISLVLLFTPGSVVQKAYIDASTAARIIVWQDAGKAIVDKSLFGWGPENFVYAQQLYINNNLFLDENLGEVWFDRAHNVFVDTLVGSGFVGLLAFVLLVLALWFAVFRAHRKGLIGQIEAILLAALPVAHVVQLQTAFDTVPTYVLLSIIGGYVLWLEYQLKTEDVIVLSPVIRRSIAVVLILVALISAKYMLYDQLVRQQAFHQTFTPKNHADRIASLELAFSGRVDAEMLRLSSMLFIKGLLDQISTQGLSQEGFNNALQLADIYDAQYQSFLKEHPTYYRARVNYAYLLLIKTIVGEDGLADAKSILKDSYALAPQNPLTYYEDALAETYGGNFQAAKQKADAAIALNPLIKQSKLVRNYIDKQQQSFPEITVLRLENI